MNINKGFINIQKSDLELVNKEIKDQLYSLSILPGIYTGKDVIKLNELILNYLTNRLKKYLNIYDISILKYAYKEIENIQSERKKGNNIFDDKVEISNHFLAVQYVISAILKWRPEGYKKINYKDWKYLLSLALLINNFSQEMDIANFELYDFEIYITESYEIKNNLDSLWNSLTEYSSKIFEKRIDYLTTNEKTVLDDEVFNFIYEKHYGFSFKEKLYFLCYLMTLEPGNAIKLFEKELLINHISNNINDSAVNENVEYTREKVIKILEDLSLTNKSYENINIIGNSNLMRYVKRINLCPIISINEKILYGEEMCFLSATLWGNYYNEGNVSFDKKEIPTEIFDYLNRIHHDNDTMFEKITVEHAIEIMGEKWVEGDLQNFHRLSKELERRPSCGQIDLLVVNEKKKIIFVIDSKNIGKIFRIYNISQQFSEFFSSKESYLSKLIKKRDYIHQNIEIILPHFGLEYDQTWNVKMAFCLSDIHAFTFIKKIENTVDFVLLDELEKHIL